MTINTRGVVVVTATEARKSHEYQVELPPLAEPVELPPDVEDDEDPPELFSAGFAGVDEVEEVVSFLAACL